MHVRILTLILILYPRIERWVFKTYYDEIGFYVDGAITRPSRKLLRVLVGDHEPKVYYLRKRRAPDPTPEESAQPEDPFLSTVMASLANFVETTHQLFKPRSNPPDKEN